MPRGDLFILSAPSGTGKTTLIHSMLRGGTGSLRDLAFSVSHTTRSPRRGEVDGTDYHFVDRATFARMVDEDRFVEHAEYNRNLYGTSRDEVEPRLERGEDVILEIEVQGAEQVVRRYPQAVSIFVMPPGFAALRERLSQRGLDGEETVRRRLSVSYSEIRCYSLYDYAIVNDDAKRASEALAAIILARRHRRERMEERAEAILRDFEAAFDRDRETLAVPESAPRISSTPR
ncbi:MAG TPA: guanylate kinase [Thermoanaerobaculia bacterium]|jgi:guanylate kinase|nr:guanylate kinase [Thermoanaerobaculia bacterium]